ncbi:MAG TPA: PEP-CTERM sorting domain-containing protein [Verrucomicrobiae bacterium]|nr:PEP-CTERM sorting domain-containing protein [Verrucomicrobiae bacterium]
MKVFFPSVVGRVCVVTIVLLWITRATVSAGVVFTNDFSDGRHDWEPGFADYPPSDESQYELTADQRPRPTHLGGASALFISGNNHSDDLFMFWRNQVAGLAPDTEYEVVFEIELASKYATGLFGIGGAPGDSVYLKAGAVRAEPKRVVENGLYQMNLNKGNQSEAGLDMIVLGTIAKPDDGNMDYVMVGHSNTASPFRTRSDAAGKLWVIFGTESGFEGTTSLYFTRFTATFRRVAPPALSLQLLGPAQVELTWDDWVLESSADLGNWRDETNAASPLTVNLAEAPTRFWRLRSP